MIIIVVIRRMIIIIIIVLQATTSGIGVLKLPRDTTTIYTRRKTKTRTSENPSRKQEKSELECLLRAEEKGGERHW